MRLPVIPTIIVALAIAMMIGLGIWQIQRAAWKGELLAGYEAAQGLPPMAWPQVSDPDDLPLYRRSSLHCLQVTGWRATSGRSAKGESGWAHVASCSLGGAEGPGAQVVAGWSRRPDNPDWKGGPVSGVIAPDSHYGIRLVADPPVAGLEASRKPSLEDIPNNHMAYAVQWFLFALAAGVIYILALRRRRQL